MARWRDSGSVLVWQYVFGIQLSWIVLPLAIFLMLAVGADYNLLLVSRFKEEIGAGLKTGYIRTFLTPSIATLLGRWFWWPLNVRNRPARHPVAARRTSGDLLEEEPDTRPHRVVSPEDPA